MGSHCCWTLFKQELFLHNLPFLFPAPRPRTFSAPKDELDVGGKKSLFASFFLCSHSSTNISIERTTL